MARNIFLILGLYLILIQTTFASESRVLQVDGHKIHIGIWGDIEKNNMPWAVLLSGPIGSWHSDSAWFASLAPTLAKTHRVIAIDRAGLVTNQAGAPVGYRHFTADIAEVFNKLEIKKPIVISFASSNISLQLLLQNPEQQKNIRRAYLIDPDALTNLSSARYIEDAKPFKDNLDKYVEYISAGKYTERVKQKNAADREKVESLTKQDDDIDWGYFNTLFEARLALNNQVNLFREIAIYNEDLKAVMTTNWPTSVPVTIFDTDFELEYVESAQTDELRQSLLAWKEDAKGYYQSIAARHTDSEYIETLSRSHLYQFEHLDKLIKAILARKN